MAQEKNFAAREAAMVCNSKSIFNHLFLADGSLYAEGRKCPVMKNVKKVSVGSRYNKIVTQDGVYVFTPDWQTLVSFAKQHSVQLQGYRVSAETEIAVDSDLELVKGENMKVVDALGGVLHESVRGFIPINRNYHLARYNDGGWRLCNAQGEALRATLVRVNLTAGRRVMFFDERGKLRQNAWEPHYCDILTF